MVIRCITSKIISRFKKSLFARKMSKVSPIRSLYIAHIERSITAEYIADVLEKSGIATVSRIAIEANKSRYRKGLPKLYQAFVDIEYWHDTECALNFLRRLRNNSQETRLIHSYQSEDWWVVQVNTAAHKTAHNTRKRHLTIFVNNYDYDLECEIIRFKRQHLEVENRAIVSPEYSYDEYEETYDSPVVIPMSNKVRKFSFDSIDNSCMDEYLREINEYLSEEGECVSAY